MGESVHEHVSTEQETQPPPPSAAQLRADLIHLTVELADELAATGDTDRLAALAALYQMTRETLHALTLRGAR